MTELEFLTWLTDKLKHFQAMDFLLEGEFKHSGAVWLFDNPQIVGIAHTAPKWLLTRGVLPHSNWQFDPVLWEFVQQAVHASLMNLAAKRPYREAILVGVGLEESHKDHPMYRDNK
jgi:hypothetical protein